MNVIQTPYRFPLTQANSSTLSKFKDLRSNHDKGVGFNQLGNPYTPYCSSSVEAQVNMIKICVSTCLNLSCDQEPKPSKNIVQNNQ